MIQLLVAAVLGTAPAPVIPIETNETRKPLLKATGDLFIKGGRILTVSHGVIEKGNLLIRKGKIVAIGNVKAPAGVPVLDATGKVIAPGIVDAHMHRGTDVVNEGTDAIVAECRILDSLNPDKKDVWQAVASGETTGMILHGSANPVGAESVVAKLKYRKLPTDMPIPDAPRMIKFALGENVTRSGSTSSGRFPHTRMGVEATYRRAFTQAREYLKSWEDYRAKAKKDPNARPPQRDLRLETLGDILQRKVWVQCHSYRADEILMMVRLSQEFGFKIGAMQHALESYKVAPELAKAGVGASIFADDWAVKLELYDCIPYAASILNKAGALVSINTDGTGGTAAINIDAAKTMRFGGLSETDALKLITLNPAKELGVDHRVGSLDIGKDGDVVIWDGHPLSVYSKVQATVIEGELYFQRRDQFKVDAKSPAKPTLPPVHYDPNPSVPANGSLYAIVGGYVHPVSGPDLPHGTVLLKDGKILAVGANIKVPKGAIVVDARGKQVYPGFIDAGTMIGLTEFGQVGQATDVRENGTFQPDLIAATAFQAESAHIGTTRSQGVTTIFTQPRGGTVSGLGSVMNLGGFTSEQMTLKKRAGLCLNLGSSFNFDFEKDVCAGGEVANSEEDDHSHDMQGGAPPKKEPANSGGNSELSRFFEKAAKYGREHTTIDLGLEEVQPAFRKQLPLFLRVNDRAGISNAIQFAKKWGVKVVLVGCPESWKEVKLLVENQIPVILNVAGKSTLDANTTVNDWDPYDTPYVTPYLLEKAGVKFCFQSDSYAEAKNLPSRAAMSCGYGLSKPGLIRALTLSAAEILGVADQVGSIEKGKLGNLVISDGDPFEMTGTIRYVFINGKPIQLTSKFTQLRDKYLQRLTGKG